MNDIHQHSRTTHRREGLLADPGRIAPHVEKGWRDDLILELRLLDVPGERIGDALMTVETHVADSGECAREAFGGPAAYAREIAASEGSAGTGWSVNVWTVVGNMAGLVGMLVAVQAFSSWLEGEPVAVTAGQLAALAILLLLVGAVLAWSTAALRLIVERGWAVAAVAPIVLVSLFVAVYLLLPGVVLEVAVLPVALLALVLLAVGVVASWLDGPVDGDEIVAPGQPASGSAGSRLLSALVLPSLTVLLLGLAWVLHVVAR